MALFSGRASAFVVSLGARAGQEAGRVACAAALRLVVGTASALCLFHPVMAQQTGPAFVVPYSGTLKKINDSGVIRIGHRENSPPFAFLDPGGSRSATRWTSATSSSRRSPSSSGRTSLSTTGP